MNIYDDNVFKRYVQSLSMKEQKDVYLRLNSENRYSDKVNLTPTLKNLKTIYNKLSFSKTIERRLNGNVAKIIPGTDIVVNINPEKHELYFDNNTYIFTVDDKTLYLVGKESKNISDLIEYLKTNFKMKLIFNGNVVNEPVNIMT